MGDFNTDVFINLKWDSKTGDFKMDSNAKDPKDLILQFIHTQLGEGEDPTPREEHDLYEIHLELDLSHDVFRTTHNCGNKGLRDGILLHYAESM